LLPENFLNAGRLALQNLDFTSLFIAISIHRKIEKINTHITASTKPEYPVIDRNPPLTTVVGNFNTLDYLCFTTITSISSPLVISPGLSLKLRVLQWWPMDWLVGGFMYAYKNSADIIMDFFSNEAEVVLHNKKWFNFWGGKKFFLMSKRAALILFNFLTNIDPILNLHSWF
jgi:hypothetical protein